MIQHLVACTGCGYWFFTIDPPRGEGHCRNGRWVHDFNALDVPAFGKHDTPPYWSYAGADE